MPGESAPQGRSVCLAAVLAMLALAAAVAGCGEEDEHEVVEGEPVELGHLSYNVQLTRFLNRRNIEDAELLVGQPPAPMDSSYLGVFLRITNESDRELRSADRYVISDIRGGRYRPVDSESPFALEVGAPVPAEGQLPQPDSVAGESGAGALLLFLVDDVVIDRRPIKLEIPGEEEAAEVELDI